MEEEKKIIREYYMVPGIEEQEVMVVSKRDANLLRKKCRGKGFSWEKLDRGAVLELGLPDSAFLMLSDTEDINEAIRALASEDFQPAIKKFDR